MEPAKVRCADCGFLSIRQHGGVLNEVTDALRAGNVISATQEIVCFVRKAKLQREIDATNVQETFRKERLCDGFMDWLQGVAPKEHLEIRMNLELIKRQEEQAENARRWEEKREEKSRRWEAEREERNAKHEQEWQNVQKQLQTQQLEEQRRSRRATMTSAIVNALIAGGLGLLAVYVASKTK